MRRFTLALAAILLALGAAPAFAQNTIPYETGTSGVTQNVVPKAGATAGQLSASTITDNGTIISITEPLDFTSNPSVTEIANASSTGTTLNKLAKYTGAPSTAVIAGTGDTTGVIGIVIGGAGTTSNAQIAVNGQASCVFDAATTAGHYVQASTTAGGSCHDAGASYPGSNQVLGVVLSTNGAGGTFLMQVYPSGIVAATGGGGAVASVFTRTGAVTAQSGDYSFSLLSGNATAAQGGTGLTTLTSGAIYKGNGTGNIAVSALSDNGTLVSTTESIDLTTTALVGEIANAGTTGTTVNKLAKFTGAPSTAVITATTDTTGAIGIVIGGAGTTSNAQIAFEGQASCVFDGATTAGHYVSISTTSGDCHDAGATLPTTGQVLGVVLSTNGGTGTYAMTLFGSNRVAGAQTGVANAWTASQRGTPVTPSISGSTFTPNFDTAQNLEIDLIHASCPCTLANPSTTLVAGQSGIIEVHQSATGSDTITTWGSSYQYVGGTSTITLSTGANAVDYLSYYVNNAATGIVFGSILKAPAH